MNTTTNMINVTVDCNCFIIPNSLAKANVNNSFGRKLADKAAEIAATNGFEYDESLDKFVQLWWVGCNSDNMQDHGFTIEVDGQKYRFGYEMCLELVPVKFFKGHKEGEILPLTISLKPRHDEGEEVPTFNVTFNLKLNQLDYRYRRFGRFEEVLKLLAA